MNKNVPVVHLNKHFKDKITKLTQARASVHYYFLFICFCSSFKKNVFIVKYMINFRRKFTPTFFFVNLNTYLPSKSFAILCKKRNFHWRWTRRFFNLVKVILTFKIKNDDPTHNFDFCPITHYSSQMLFLV